jgi:hypothetical protein
VDVFVENSLEAGVYWIQVRYGFEIVKMKATAIVRIQVNIG